MVEQGFADPVFDAQRVFRTLLTAMSEPGRVLPMPAACAPPGWVEPTAMTIALALCDADTPVWLAPKMRNAADFLRFQTGAPIVSCTQEALFVLAGVAERPSLAQMRAGEPDYPDRSATLILVVDHLEEGFGWRVSGPGVPGQRAFLPRSLDCGFVSEWRENRARFPLGVDILFVARDVVVGLPRSAHMET
jgi:alpha-D-ribose 1-methylphosphonate 5-triphosphate synthase subunit PhnH